MYYSSRNGYSATCQHHAPLLLHLDLTSTARYKSRGLQMSLPDFDPSIEAHTWIVIKRDAGWSIMARPRGQWMLASAVIEVLLLTAAPSASPAAGGYSATAAPSKPQRLSPSLPMETFVVSTGKQACMCTKECPCCSID